MPLDPRVESPHRWNMNKPTLPGSPMKLSGFGDADGSVISHAGRYARECVLIAFEMIGGTERLADWADKNPGEFYTRLFPKVITKEVDLNAGQGIEALLSRLDKGERNEPIIDADYEIE